VSAAPPRPRPLPVHPLDPIDTAVTDRRLPAFLAPLLAGALASVAVAAGWRGVDFPAQLYRVGLFHRAGLVLWDSQWYGGHWILDYSVLFPPVAGTFGIQATEVLSAAGAAFAFDRLVVGHYGTRARLGSLLFAAGTLAQVAVGQLPFLLGEALALGACLAAAKRRWLLAAALAGSAALASPLAGAFAVLVMLAWLLATWPRHSVALGAVAAAGAVPVLASALVFPGAGAMPFPAVQFLELGALFVGLWLVLPRAERALRIGVAVYLVAIAASFVLETPVGGNVSRLGGCLGVPLVVCALWPRRRWVSAAAIVPLVLFQWSSAFAAVASDRSDPSARATYFDPLVRFLGAHKNPLGRVEVVPTRLHWEAAYVAPEFPLARGWERQLDTADNPLFYERGALTPSAYRGWLLDNGVRYVALSDTALDYAGRAEARLIGAGVIGLGPAERLGHWRVFSVSGSTGLVHGPGAVTRVDANGVSVHVDAPGTVVVRIHYDPRWAVVAGAGCVRGGPGDWMTISSPPGDLRLQLRLIGGGDTLCPPASP